MKRLTITMDPRTEYLSEKYKQHMQSSANDFFRAAATGFFMPTTPELRDESNALFELIDAKIESPETIKGCLSRSLKALENHPVDDPEIINKIMVHFRTGVGRAYRYDYPFIVNPEQDETLHHLNEILFTLDNDYNLGRREFGERSRDIIKQWDSLKGYGETYIALSTIIDCEEIYYPLDTYKGLALIKELDDSIYSNPAKKEAEKFVTNVPIEAKVAGANYELLVYCCDNGYADISGDHNFDRMPLEWREYADKVFNLGYEHNEASEEYLKKIKDLIAEATNMLRKLYRKR